MSKSFDRRDFMKASGLGAAALAISDTAKAGGPRGNMPNILWLVSEDNSPLLGCYGDDYATTPNLDALARESVVFDNAFANAPVCAPARCTIHTGMYASSLGTQHMRSMNPIPDDMRFFTEYLREAGYHCVNGNKTDYNTTGAPKGAWNDRKFSATLKGLDRRQPFFRFINFMVSHESSLHRTRPLRHDPDQVSLAPYHPDTPEIRRDYAQYYDQLTILDEQVGEVLKELDERGLAEDTIVFYFSDHGGILPRGKRYLYDSGMRVPMMAHFPEKYRDLSVWGPGTRTDRLVSFIDLAPTVLSLAGLDIPEHMQGDAFLGEKAAPPPEYVYGFRGRMDERYDMCRAVRDKRFKYIRNYMPHYPHGRHLDYLWKMKAMQSWEEQYKTGNLDEAQRAYFEPKPMEELFDLEADPHEINNLADDPGYRDVLVRMRQANREFLLEIRDAGFMHEAEMSLRSEGSTPYAVSRDGNKYDLPRLMDAADTASRRDPAKTDRLIEMLGDDDAGVRYWGAVGCAALGDKAGPAADALARALNDPSPSVSIAVAEALCGIGRCDEALPVLGKALSDPNMWVGLHAVDALYNMDVEAGPAIERKKRSVLSKVRRKTTVNALR